MLKKDPGASFVITHHVLDDKIEDYENWLDRISNYAKEALGLLDWNLVRPVTGVTSTYNILLRFKDKDSLETWFNSENRKLHIEEVKPLLAKDHHYYIGDGLDFLFMSGSSTKSAPKKWKQFLLTWAAIFSMNLCLPGLVKFTLRYLGLPELKVIDTLFVSGAVVYLMVYVVMPFLAQSFRQWLNVDD